MNTFPTPESDSTLLSFRYLRRLAGITVNLYLEKGFNPQTPTLGYATLLIAYIKLVESEYDIYWIPFSILVRVIFFPSFMVAVKLNMLTNL